MKVVVRILLAAAIALLAFLCSRSIQEPIDFKKEVASRDNAVIQRLVDIRSAQVAYRTQNGSYTASFDTLANFVKTGKIVTISRTGELTEAQLEAGMTEAKAMDIIRKGNVTAIKAAGLWNDQTDAPQLVRDSIFAPALGVLYPGRTVNADSLQFVPFGKGAKFEMAKGQITTASGYPVEVFEVKTPYTAYLGDLDEKLLGQKIQEVLDRPGDKYPGLMIGSLDVANNNAGNWE